MSDTKKTTPDIAAETWAAVEPIGTKTTKAVFLHGNRVLRESLLQIVADLDIAATPAPEPSEFFPHFTEDGAPNVTNILAYRQHLIRWATRSIEQHIDAHCGEADQ